MYYREYFDPDPLLDDEACMGDVGDDLIDTYQDIRSGLLLFERAKHCGFGLFFIAFTGAATQSELYLHCTACLFLSADEYALYLN
jgi:hypothetical protein